MILTKYFTMKGREKMIFETWKLYVVLAVIIFLLFFVMGNIKRNGKLYYILDYVFIGLMMTTAFILACDIIKTIIKLSGR